MLNILKFLNPTSVSIATVRNTARYNPRSNKTKLYKNKDRELIAGTISYYPRVKGEPEPEHEAPKLFKVTRVKPMRGQPFWDRRILRDFGLFINNSVAIVKNIPENNQRLWKVKHLIQIEPITFPHGEPTFKDVNHTFLRENGECLVVKEIGKKFVKDRIRLANKTKNEQHALDKETLKRDSRMKWLNPWQ